MTPTGITDLEMPMGAPTELPLYAAQPAALNAPKPPQETTPTFADKKRMIDQLIRDFDTEEKPRIENRRELRRNRMNRDDYISRGVILPDETVIADHTIDYNIAQEKSAYLQYLEQSRTLLTLTPRPKSSIPPELVERLELEFTLGSRYNRWKNAWFKIIDACIMHGAIGFEVVADTDKPLNYAIEYIRREDFMFPKKMRVDQLDDCEMVLRAYDYPVWQFERWSIDPKSGFNPAICKDIVGRHENQRLNTFRIYKVYYRENGVIMSGWYSDTANATDWLKVPTPHHIGLMAETMTQPEPSIDPFTGQLVMSEPQSSWQPVPCTSFPFVLFPYSETEDGVVLDIPGRVAQDVYTQEAVGSLLTSTVNGAKRASGLYAGMEPAVGADPNAAGVLLQHGKAVQGKMNFYQPAWPNAIALSVVQTLSVRNTQQMGRVDFAAMARQDTAKTATEIGAAETQAAALGSIKVGLLADAIVRAYSLGFEIARTQAAAGLIPMLSQFPREVLLADYQLAPSGDVEVLKRQEKLQKMKEFFGVIQNTAAAPAFLEYLIKQAFPEESETLIAALKQGNMSALVANLVDVIKKLIPTVPAHEQQSLTELVTAAESMVAGPGNPAATTQAGGPQAVPPVNGNESGGATP